MTLRKEVIMMVLVGSVCLPGFQTDLNAACSRSDVEYYLEKGFSHEQVTAICSSSAGDAAGETPRSPEMKESDVSREDPGKPEMKPKESEAPLKNSESTEDRGEIVSEPTQENTFNLAMAIDGYDVEVGPESMHYTTKDCFEYGEEDIYGFRKKACPEVRFSIYYDGMEAEESGMKYFFYGPRGIRVKGRIERRILSGLDHLGKGDRKEALKKLDGGDETVILIRKGNSLDKVVNALMDLRPSRPN